MIRSRIKRFLEQRRFPTLMLIGAALFFVNLFVPDPIPFLDEILLLIATLLIGSFKRWRADDGGDKRDKNRGDAAGTPTDADRQGKSRD